jgi:hypothetical protein
VRPRAFRWRSWHLEEQWRYSWPSKRQRFIYMHYYYVVDT